MLYDILMHYIHPRKSEPVVRSRLRAYVAVCDNVETTDADKSKPTEVLKFFLSGKVL